MTGLEITVAQQALQLMGMVGLGLIGFHGMKFLFDFIDMKFDVKSHDKQIDRLNDETEDLSAKLEKGMESMQEEVRDIKHLVSRTQHEGKVIDLDQHRGRE